MKTYGPYSPIKRAGNTFYVSGQIGINPDDSSIKEDIVGQAEQALINLQSTLHIEGLSLDNVAKTTIYVTDMGTFSEVNKVYEQYFKAPRPARATIAVAELPRLGGTIPVLIEIEAIAYKETA